MKTSNWKTRKTTTPSLFSFAEIIIIIIIKKRNRQQNPLLTAIASFPSLYLSLSLSPFPAV
jgi:hypothetical protein